MWKCPICEKENSGNTICDCGWTKTKDYLTYSTVCPIGEAENETLCELLYGAEYAVKKGQEFQSKGRWEEAVSFYEKAAEKGNLEAIKCLGNCFWKGLGTKKNLYKALYWYCKIMMDDKEDVSQFMDSIYDEIKKSRENNVQSEHEKENVSESRSKKNILSKNYFSVIGKDVNKDQIENIYFKNTIPKYSSVKTCSVSSDGSVQFWLERKKKSYSSSSCDLYIGAEGGVDAPEDCNGLFYGFINVKSIIFQNNFRTQNVKNMSRMFYDCWNLKTLDISSFDSRNVKDMSRMFGACRQLEKLNLRNFNTSRVEDISWMFYGCKQLKELDLSSFDTQNVRDMSWMFWQCESLEELNLSSFNTQNVTTMCCMFNNCKSLKKLNLSDFDTRNVTDMNQMFADCSGLEIVYVGQLDTGNVTRMYEMFRNCRADLKKKILKTSNSSMTFSRKAFSSDVSKNIRNKDEPAHVFGKNILSKDYFSAIGKEFEKKQIRSIVFENTLPKDSSVKTYNVSSNNSVRLWLESRTVRYNEYIIDLHIGAEGGVDAPEDCNGLFYGFINVENIIFRNNFRTQNVKNMSRMFYDCWNLKALDISNFDSRNVKDMSRMFGACRQLEKLNLRNFNTSRVEDISWMFYGCKELKELDLSSFDTQNVRDMSWMFWQCENLEELNLSSFNTQNVTTMCCMFNNCKSLKKLNLSNFDTRNVTDMNQMFADCRRLETVYGGQFDTRNVTRMYEMFRGCRTNLQKIILDKPRLK